MSQHLPLNAAFWMTGAIVSFTSMAVAGRELSVELDTFEIMTYRSLIGLAIVIAVSRRAGTWNQINTGAIGLHAIRNLSHFAGQNLWFFAITVAPLAQVFAFEFTSPLWVTLMAPLFLGERMTVVRALSALMGFAGILVVAHPGANFIPGPGLIAAALAAIGFAGSAVFTRLLTRTQTVTCILFFLTLMQTIFGLVCAGLDADIAWPSAAAWPWLGLIGLAGLVAHFCLTKALGLAPAAVVMPMDFARLPIVALVGMAVYAEPLEISVLLGGVIIFAANYLNIRTEARAASAR